MLFRFFIFFLLTLPTFAYEELYAKKLNFEKSFQAGFMEGEALGEEGTFYFSNAFEQSRAIMAVDLKSPDKKAKILYRGAAGGTWFQEGRITFTGGPSAGVYQLKNIEGENKDSELKALASGKVAGSELIAPNDLVGDQFGSFYFTDKKGQAIYYTNGDNTILVASYSNDGDKSNDRLEELNNPNGIILSKDKKTLYVTDNSNILYAPILEPGKLAQPLKHLLPSEGIIEKDYCQKFDFKKEVIKSKKRTKIKWHAKYGGNLNIDGMSIDKNGTIYGAALSSGIVFGWHPQTGKLLRVIHFPGGITNLTIGGKNQELLIGVGQSFGIATVILD